jgi:hypothetical protein
MGCNCGGKNAGQQYPYEAVMPDGSRVMVSSAAMERTEKEKARARMRQQSAGKGYTVRA